MRKLYLILVLLSLALPSKAAYLLIPMDNTQTNHLKAYGVAYWVLQREVEISWLLNYRGGSYLIPYHDMFERECKMRNVSYNVIADAQADVLGALSDGEAAVEEVVELLAAGQVVGRDGVRQVAFGRNNPKGVKPKK